MSSGDGGTRHSAALHDPDETGLRRISIALSPTIGAWTQHLHLGQREPLWVSDIDQAQPHRRILRSSYATSGSSRDLIAEYRLTGFRTSPRSRFVCYSSTTSTPQTSAGLAGDEHHGDYVHCSLRIVAWRGCGGNWVPPLPHAAGQVSAAA